jgi:glucose/arabinose dehydrogenase
MSLHTRILTIAAATLMLAGCGDSSQLPETAATGPNPTLPSPNPTLLPTIDVATAKGWPDGTTPKAASDLAVKAFARRLDHPRWLHVLPNGDVLVAETNAPPRPEEGKGVKGMVFSYYQKRAGAGVPSANRITLLRDADGDGVAEIKETFLKDLNSPFGMALVDNELYVANADAVMRFPYRDGDTQISEPGTKVADLPGVRSTITGPRALSPAPTGRVCTSRSARTAISARTASTRRSGAPRSWRSTARGAARAYLPRGCAIPSAWRSRRRATRYGRW